MTIYKVAISVAAVSILGLGAAGFYQGFASIARPVSQTRTAAISAPAAPSAGTIVMALSTNSPVDDPTPAPTHVSWRHAARLMAPADPSDDLNAAQQLRPTKTAVSYTSVVSDQDSSGVGPAAPTAPVERIQ